MVYQDVGYLFDFLDLNLSGFLTALEIQDFEHSLHFDDALDLQQIDAAIKCICENADSTPICRKEEFSSLLNELERRREIQSKVEWDFKALDLERRGKISIQDTLFLFKAVHEERFSAKLWNNFLHSRLDPVDDVTFSEVKLFLCNIIPFDPSTYDEFSREYSQCRKRDHDQNFRRHKSLLSWQDEGASILSDQRKKQTRSDRIRSAAGHLLNRIDETGPQVLLQDDADDENELYATQPMERVGASVLLDALKKKHEVLREKLLTDMLRIHIGEGMWTAFSEREQQDRLLKLKVQEEQLRKEGKIKTMASTLPGSKHGCNYSLLKLMGESSAEELVTQQAILERMKETDIEKHKLWKTTCPVDSCKKTEPSTYSEKSTSQSDMEE